VIVEVVSSMVGIETSAEILNRLTVRLVSCNEIEIGHLWRADDCIPDYPDLRPEGRAVRHQSTAGIYFVRLC
jgi:hypothetical protein